MGPTHTHGCRPCPARSAAWAGGAGFSPFCQATTAWTPPCASPAVIAGPAGRPQVLDLSGHGLAPHLSCEIPASAPPAPGEPARPFAWCWVGVCSVLAEGLLRRHARPAPIKCTTPARRAARARRPLSLPAPPTHARRRQVCFTNGQQTMGVSLPWAISAAFDARDPGRCGDRSYNAELGAATEGICDQTGCGGLAAPACPPLVL